MTLIGIFFWFSGLALAQPAVPAASGYVVRVDSSNVYLDLGAKAGAAVGQGFVIYTEGEELKHPVTGQILGRLDKKIADGTLQEIADAYSVGRLALAAAEVKVGMRARLGFKDILVHVEILVDPILVDLNLPVDVMVS